MVVELYW